ncbi:MAG: energy-coupling factor transporter ATPase [Coriobacteriales bacterium]|nr:energy-coupling factor transporter ATPase [Coriobacteriales bacterium]
MPAIEFCDVSYAYQRGGATGNFQHALVDVNLTVGRGEFIAVLGANGSGKSTLAQQINALLTPDSGRVLVAAMDTSQPELAFAIRSTAGLLFQNPDSQMVASVVADDVAFGPENLCLPHDGIVQRVDEALEAVKMTAFAERDPHLLSGGQKQRVCIAGLLAMQPDVLVLDEPGAMLDARGRRGIRRVVSELNAAGMTVVLITHFMEEAARADRLVVMERGRVVLDGSPRDIFSQRETLRDLGLDLPFTVRLAEALRQRGLEMPEVVSPSELHAAVLATTQGAPPPVLLAPPVSHPLPQRPSHCPSPQDNPLITLHDVSFVYPGDGAKQTGTAALEGINLNIAEGSLVALIGHSGSGKSTLLQLIGGLEQPDTGTITVAGQALASRKVRAELHRTIGIAFQYPEYQLFGRTVAEEVGFGPRNAGLSTEETEARVREALALVGLRHEEFAERWPFSLSGGERRRVALAGILAQDAPVLLLDEPTNGLDPQTHRAILALIARLHQQGRTIVLVAHDMDDVAALAERVVVLNTGQVLLDGPPAQVFVRYDELRAVNLDVPQPTAFARKLGLAQLPLTLEALADALADKATQR